AGADVLTLFDTPDGANINLGSGATAPQALQRAVVEHTADVGFAFDGDGDRVMTVDATGAVLDGDFVLALAARHFAKHGKLDPKLVVGTVTTNVKAPRRGEWKDGPSFSSAVREAETELGAAGRLVVRASGTEPLLRITVEARDDAMARRIAESLAAEAMEALA